MAIAQTEDGYLWVGSSSGLYRFDGVAFVSYPVTRLDTSLPVAGVAALLSDGQGGLWIGYDHAGISHLTRTGVVTNYNRHNKLGPHSVVKFLRQPDNSVWCLGDNQVLVLDGDRWENFGSRAGLPSDQYLSLYLDRKGDLWTSARKKLYVLHPGEKRFGLYPIESFVIVDMAEEPDGRLWVSDGWRSIHPLDSTEPRITVDGYVRLLEAEGSLWMAEDYRGITHARSLPHATGFPELLKEGHMSSEQTNVIFADRDNNIWVGTSRGLDRFHSSNLREVANTRIEYYPSLALARNGLVWIGLLSHPLLQSNGQTLTPVGPKVGSSPMITDSVGRLWLVDPILRVLYSYGPEGIKRIPTPIDVHGVDAQSIGLDRDGAILVSFEASGLWRYDGSWHRVLDKILHLDDPLSIFRDPAGDVWLGYPGEVVVHDGHGFHVISDTQTADVGSVLTFNVSHGTIWIGGSNGVAYFAAGVFHSLSLQRGGLLRGVSGIVEDGTGNLWLNASAGIMRIKASEIDAALHDDQHLVDFDVMDQRQGIDWVAAQSHPTPSAIGGGDGLLWFSRLGTVFSLRPADFSTTANLPKPQIESVLLNGVPYRDREHQAGELAISTAHLAKVEFDYVDVDLIAPDKLIYQYMLAGEDKTWQEAGSSRQAFYTHLGPGTYEFRVRATVGGGRWVELTTPIPLTVRPEFYQTLWFRTACLLFAVALLYGVYLLRIGIVTSRLRERLQVRSGERLRIARELHDTLLQAIHGLMLRVHFATEALPESEPAKSPLEQALKNADALILEGRRRVQDLREEIPEDGELSAQIARVAVELELEKCAAFRVIQEGNPRDLEPEIQSELCRIAREALRNSRYHARATVVEVHLIFEISNFVMKCCDNGVGVPASIVTTGNRPGHWGLASMRERTIVIGGLLQVWSAPGGGTEVIVKLSARRAYLASASQWSKLLRNLRVGPALESSSDGAPKDAG